MDDLNYNFSYTGLKIVNLSEILKIKDLDTHFEEAAYYNILANFSFDDEVNESFYDFLETLFEDYYNFTFENIDPDDNSTWPSYMQDIDINDNFVTIGEANEYNPKDYSIMNATELLKPIMKYTFEGKRNLVDKSIRDCNNPTIKGKCKGLIYYDYSDDSFNTGVSGDSYLPRIYINGSVGKSLLPDLDEYTVDFYLNQSYNYDVESYNIIGVINGTNQIKKVVIGSLYDSLWSQGTADAAVGCGIVLAIAEQMKELENIGIIPKYKTKFIFFGGEEWGYKGAKHYTTTHKIENIKAMIDLNQLGMKRLDTENDPPLLMNTIVNKRLIQCLLEIIYERNNYEDETGYDARSLFSAEGSVSNDNAFNLFKCKTINTICFLKDAGWYLHHRDGMNHTMGDIMDNIDWNDVNKTADLVWNVSKFFDYSPDVWFDGNPSFQLYDTSEDGYHDCLNVTYIIDTSWPNEQVSVKLVLYPKFILSHPVQPILYRLREDESYIVTPDGINGYINITLPKNYPKGVCLMKLYFH
jgi:hypothetical protein